MAFTAKPLRDFLAAQEQVEDLKPVVGQTIRALRIQSGITQTALAASAGVTQAYLSMIENDAKTPSSDSLNRIVDALEGSTSANSEEGNDQEEEDSAQG